MLGTRFRRVLRESLGNIYREVKIAITPLPQPEKWVFLVGCYNSGTTLLAELMSRHPHISALPTEGHFITDQFVKDYDIGLPRMWVGREDLFRLSNVDVGPDSVRIKKEWGMRLDLSKPVLLEKSPPNSARTLWLQEHFENAHFIGIVRNGYAVAEGIRRKADPQHLPNSWSIEQTATQWARSNEILEEDSKNLKHFKWVKYEDLAREPHKALNSIADFLSLPSFSDFNNEASLSIHEREQSVRDLNDESIRRLSQEDIAAINKIAGDSLDLYGYTRIEP
jgi:hypothetical protein